LTAQPPLTRRGIRLLVHAGQFLHTFIDRRFRSAAVPKAEACVRNSEYEGRCVEDPGEGPEASCRSSSWLAGSLIESLDEAVDEKVEAAWADEIAQRVAELDSGKAKTIPWSKARRLILSR